VQKVVKGPIHPYVQELMRSIPVPNPRHRWPRESTFGARHETLGKKEGCIFLERCPHPKDRCRDFDPEIVEFETDHFAACHVPEAAPAR
jgi:oligopeptide/dipeptide ABC transporter ATP-binding protein